MAGAGAGEGSPGLSRRVVPRSERPQPAVNGGVVPDRRNPPDPDDRRLVELSERAIDNVNVTPVVGVPSMNLVADQAAGDESQDIDA